MPEEKRQRMAKNLYDLLPSRLPPKYQLDGKVQWPGEMPTKGGKSVNSDMYKGRLQGQDVKIKVISLVNPNDENGVIVRSLVLRTRNSTVIRIPLEDQTRG